MYSAASPAQSTTSLSDIDDDPAQSNFFSQVQETAIVFSPAQWSSKRLASHPSGRGVRALSNSPITFLPPEILIHILRHLHTPRDLYRSLLVSRAWCECAVELLWHKPNFSKLSTLVKMMRVISRNDQTFTYARFIRRLNFLSLGPNLTDSLFSRLAQCVRLERLTLALCSSVSDDALSRVVACCHNLVAIDLTNVTDTTDRAVIALALSAKRLQGINLAGCKKVTNRGVSALAVNCPLLRRVKLSGLELITDEPISDLAKACPLLLEIDLNHCKQITDIAVRDLWIYSLHMREMRLSHCVELTDLAFPAPPKTDTTAPPSGPDPFPSSTAHLICELPPLVLNRTYEHLRMLDVTACANLTDDAVEGIISHSPKIRNLVFSKCSLLTDRTVETICRLGKHLHYLHLGHASNITDRSVRTLARCCTRLRYVDFANCVLLTDMSVFELSSLPKLRRIGLVRVNNLTDEAIYALAERHATLERIHLSYCDQITVMAIHFLVQKLHKLTHLSLTGIPSFRKPELQQFCRAPPSDFNMSQRAAFCVYSGKGVSELRAFLAELFTTITEDANTTDETEYDDEYDQYATRTPDAEMETGNDDDDDEEYVQPSRVIVPPANLAMYRGNRHNSMPQTRPHQHQYQQLQEHHNFGNRLSRPPHPSPTVIASRNSVPTPMANPAGQNLTRVIGPVVPGSSRAVHAFGHQPVVETSISPPASDVASNRSTGTNHSHGAGFFRTYQDVVPSSRSNGALTPDLNYAEIGHGRGTGNSALSGGPPAPMSLLTPIVGGRGLDSSSQPTSIPSTQGITQMDDAHPEVRNGHQSDRTQVLADSSNSYHIHSETPVIWPHVQPETNTTPMSGSSNTRDLHESVHNAFVSQGHEGEGRGRSVKRSLRNTINVAEHYASTLFGRAGPSDANDGN